MSALIEISAAPCKFEGGFVSIMLSAMIESKMHRERLEIRNVADADRALEAAREVIAKNHPGKDAAVIILVKTGRKPAGYDRWYESLGQRKYVKAVQS